jgi:hypothetical protein
MVAVCYNARQGNKTKTFSQVIAIKNPETLCIVNNPTGLTTFECFNLWILCDSHLYKRFHFINLATPAYVIRDCLWTMCKTSKHVAVV